MPTRVSAARLELANKPHALYRFYDRTDVLLYIGITADLAARLQSHRRDKPWWTSVANIKVEHYPSRKTALKAEAEAIQTERPLYNDQHNEHVWHDGLPAALSDINGAWLLENWPKVHSSIRDYVEVPAWSTGRLELAEALVDKFTPDEKERYTHIGRARAEADGEDGLDGPESVVRAVVAGVDGLQAEIALLSRAVELLMDVFPFEQVHRALGQAGEELAALPGTEYTDVRVQARAVEHLVYEIALTYLNDLPEADRAACLHRIERRDPGIEERDLVIEATQCARARETFGLSLRDEAEELSR